MKRKQCRAIAASTAQQCSNKALLGTSYCWLHYPKKAPLILLIIGGLVGLLLQTAYDSFTTSEEENRLKDLKETTDRGEKRVIALSQKFDGFVEFAKKLYPNLGEKEAIKKLQEAFEKFQLEYSYALIAEDGTVLERKNFPYEVRKIEPPAYIIVGLSNPKNLTLQPYEAVSSNVTEIKEGTKIKFVGAGWGNPVVYSKFKIELRK